MKKGLTTLVLAMVIFGLISAVAAVAADDLIVGREVEIEGTGIISAELRIDTGVNHPGIKLGEDLTTPGGGYNGLSSARYASSFEIGIFNDSGNVTSELGYMSNARVTNAKRSLYSSNYVIGAVMGFKGIGSSEQNVEIYTDNTGMSADFSGKILGRMKMFNKVVDVEDPHTVIVRDVVGIAGNYTFEWSAYDELVSHPESEVGGGYLDCP